MNKVPSQVPVAIRRETFNTLIDAARAERLRAASIRVVPDRTARRADTILVRNESGEDVPAGGVLAIGDVIINPRGNRDEFFHRPSLRGVLPVYSEHVGRFVVAIEAIKKGRIGNALIDGVGVARVRMVSESDLSADIDESSVDSLVSGSGAAQLLWVEPPGDRQTPDIAWCVIRIGPGPGSGIVTVRLVTFPSSGEHFGDHLICRTWNGEQEGADEIHVLLPDELRMSSWAGKWEFIDGFRVDYEPVPGGMPWSRIARIDSQDYRETQVIVPWYIDENNGGSRGPSILRCWTAAGVGGGFLQKPGYLDDVAVGLMDANNAGRAWAEKHTQQTSNGIGERALQRAGVET